MRYNALSIALSLCILMPLDSLAGSIYFYRNFALGRGKEQEQKRPNEALTALGLFVLGAGITYGYFSLFEYTEYYRENGERKSRKKPEYTTQDRLVYSVSFGTIFVLGALYGIYPDEPPTPTARPPRIPPYPVIPTSGSIESRIDGSFHGWDGETIFKLQNGQIWQQAGPGICSRYAFSPKVWISREEFKYIMRVERVETTIVVQPIR